MHWHGRADASAPQLAELNKYVSVSVSKHTLVEGGDLSFLSEYQVRLCCSTWSVYCLLLMYCWGVCQCVIMTEGSHALQCTVDEHCRTQQPSIAFIATSLHGVFTSLFVDFGPAVCDWCCRVMNLDQFCAMLI